MKTHKLHFLDNPFLTKDVNKLLWNSKKGTRLFLAVTFFQKQ
jgi:hypothetical protein